jgi:hypothetical protein
MTKNAFTTIAAILLILYALTNFGANLGQFGKGKIFLAELMQGSKHQLKMIRNGYVDSDLDILLNDTFTVPVE